MDSKLARYEDQQDRAYQHYLESSIENISSPSDKARQLTYEIRAIEKILATDTKYDLVTPEHWYDQLRDCKARLRALLRQEMSTLKATSLLHCEGLIKIHTRQIEIEAELAGLEVSR